MFVVALLPQQVVGVIFSGPSSRNRKRCVKTSSLRTTLGREHLLLLGDGVPVQGISAWYPIEKVNGNQ